YMAYADGDLSLDSGEAQEIGWNNPPEVNDEKSYEKVELYLAYLLTIPGLPTLYYGDEIGLTGAADPDNRRMMRFDAELRPAENRMLQEVRKIVKLRRTHSALRYGDFQTLGATENCFVYLRADLNERLLVVLNKSEQPQIVRIDLPKFYQVEKAVDVMTGREYTMTNHHLVLTIPAIGWQVWKIE
ncbi:MAG: alpha-glucosidase C-terminal domain-containing protein, partial [candidate division KSB1 bacterium]|nr:alpha-glucosidase C-terminal domain-containing protein [candidate division KSB1 bacterium]